MSKKVLPCSEKQLREIVRDFATPFHIYKEEDIRNNARRLQKAFAWAPAFKEYFAVKALPNPYILRILAEEGCGADCSSLPELLLSQKAGLKGSDICFTSNDTPMVEFLAARHLNAIINLDDITHIESLKKAAGLPELLSFRYNPGPLRDGGNEIIGHPEDAKYGFTKEQIFQAVEICQKYGVRRFGLHTMVVSNELNQDYLVETATMMFELALELKSKTGVTVEFVNLGGGLGIPYRPEDEPIDLEAYGAAVGAEFKRLLLPAGFSDLKICLESGRMMTGPYGWLVSTAINKKDTYKHYIGLDSCMAHLMRPALYGAYHHITVLGKENQPGNHIYDVTGSLCENNDKFAIDRKLPEIRIGDIIVIYDTGAHGWAMGFNYNGKLRSKELLLKTDGSVVQIRRAETVDDYFATLDFSQLPTQE